MKTLKSSVCVDVDNIDIETFKTKYHVFVHCHCCASICLPLSKDMDFLRAGSVPCALFFSCAGHLLAIIVGDGEKFASI